MSLKMCMAAAWSILASAVVCNASVNQAEDLWHEQVEPLLDRSCFRCHGGVRQKSGLDLRSLENILKGGDRGPAITPGNPQESHIYQFVLSGADPHMPPTEKRQLKAEEIAVLQRWIAALPATNAVAVAGTNQNVSVEAYLKAYRRLEIPVWTPPEGMAAHDVIDRFIRLGWKERHVVPSALCDDRTFARRVYLDLAGRIPTPAELEAFLSDKRPGRRAELVDELLDGPDYPRRMREVFDVVLMDRKGAKAEQERREHGWFAFLEHAFGENYGWDRIVRELILARPEQAMDSGAVWYLYERQNNYQAMAEAIAPIAFGVQINCAQCHNHPLAAEVEQRHYWGLVAALNRSKNVESSAGAGVAESAIGGFINFANLKKESQPAQMAFLNGRVVPEERPGDGQKEVDAPERYLVPPPREKEKPARPAVPKFSRRAALAEAATRNNPQLAKAFVNRIWALLMGRGLVQPVDQLDSRHRASHPALLNWLAQEFEDGGYDIKELIRQIVRSEVYQLDSKPGGEKVPPANTFARGPEKPLCAEQLYHSFLVATGVDIDAQGNAVGDSDGELRRAFASQFPDLFPSEYSASLQQATFLSNSPLLDKLLRADGKTLARILALGGAGDRVSATFELVLGRKPDREELAQCGDFLNRRAGDQGVRELFWALLTSAEFQMNH